MGHFKMLCVDLDGTLFDGKGEVSAANREALLACIEQGIRVYLVTGRPYCFARYTAGCISEKTGCICAGGGCILDTDGLFTYEIEQTALKNAMDILCKSESKAFYKGLTRFYTQGEYDERFLYQHKKELFTKYVKLQTYTGLSAGELKAQAVGILKILVCDENTKRLSRLLELLEPLEGLCVVRYNDMCFEITARNRNKGTAVKEVCLRRNIRREEVVSIGDSYNDIPMFQESGFQIAMGNAPKEIQRYADAVTGSNLQNGVAQAVSRYVL